MSSPWGRKTVTPSRSMSLGCTLYLNTSVLVPLPDAYGTLPWVQTDPSLRMAKTSAPRVDVLVEVDAYIDDLARAVGVGFVGWSGSDRETLRVGLTVHLVAGLVIESIIEAAQLDARPAGCDSAALPPRP